MRKHIINTPTRVKTVKRVVRKNYVSLVTAVVNSPTTVKPTIKSLALKIRKEMKSLATLAHDSILRDTIEAVRLFSWERVIVELFQMVPTLMLFLSHLVPKPSEHGPLLCMLASQFIKCRHPKLGLVQRAVSVMMYGNGTSKQVFILSCHAIITCTCTIMVHMYTDICFCISMHTVGIFESATPEHVSHVLWHSEDS